jgi:hypothetical protein
MTTIHRCKCIHVNGAYMSCILWKKWKWNQRFILLDETHGFFQFYKNWIQVGPYSIEHQNKNYGGLHMYMVHHCILSSCGSFDAKWDESRVRG